MPISGPVQSYSLVLPGLTNGPGPVDQPMDNVWAGCLFSHWESQTSPQYEVKLEEPGQDNCLAAMCDAMRVLLSSVSSLLNFSVVQSSAVYWSNTIDTVEIPNFGALPYLANSKLREASKG